MQIDLHILYPCNLFQQKVLCLQLE